MNSKAVLIGNSDGIGLAVTKELLKTGWTVIGLSRSPSPVNHPSYEHIVADVREDAYGTRLKSILENSESIDVCVYCAGIGELLDPTDMAKEVDIFNVNLIGMVKTASLFLPMALRYGKGHLIGLSSVADELLSPEAPSYHASKAGFSNYLEGLALALRAKDVYVTNMRFGFVDTKMAKGDVKPFMMSVDRAVQHILLCMKKKPVRYTAPRFINPLISFRRRMMRLGILMNDLKQ
ncbi:SDR family NAD(P)-dependent oxidoreductase [candidate division KSB1 bacterium]|nr:SDR family NAD(P)-dependent oxidoreductase [candidate division KSB1 bacterium]